MFRVKIPSYPVSLVYYGNILPMHDKCLFFNRIFV